MKKFFFCFLSLFFPLLSLQADLYQGPRYQLNFPYSENWSLQEEASGPDYLFQGWIAQDQEHCHRTSLSLSILRFM